MSDSLIRNANAVSESFNIGDPVEIQIGRSRGLYSFILAKYSDIFGKRFYYVTTEFTDKVNIDQVHAANLFKMNGRSSRPIINQIYTNDGNLKNIDEYLQITDVSFRDVLGISNSENIDVSDKISKSNVKFNIKFSDDAEKEDLMPSIKNKLFPLEELLEIIDQNKSAEEIILDLRDHLTN